MHAQERRLLKSLNYEFQQPELLVRALTHRSVGSGNNERLEFLGDAVLDLVISAQLYHRYADFSEGMLSRLRADLVRGESLAEIAHEIELGKCLHLGVGERKSGGFTRNSILADALEALIGAVYLDSGYPRVEEMILHIYQSRLQNLSFAEPRKDPKTRLQEFCQGNALRLPGYELKNTHGQAHELQFTVRCTLDDPPLAVDAVGSSRRKAEQACAAKVLDSLQSEGK